MADLHAELCAEADDLEGTFWQVSQQLLDAATQLKQTGRIPTEDVIDGLQQTCRRFFKLRDIAIQLAGTEGVSAIPDQSKLFSIAELKGMLHKIAEVREAKSKLIDAKQSARNVLDRVLGIVYKSGIGFPPLTQCQDQARRLKESIIALDYQGMQTYLEPLLSQVRPFFDLLTLIEEGDVIDDERWVQMQETLAQKFSRALAIATVRGRLCVAAGAPEIKFQSGIALESRPGVSLSETKHAEDLIVPDIDLAQSFAHEQPEKKPNIRFPKTPAQPVLPEPVAAPTATTVALAPPPTPAPSLPAVTPVVAVPVAVAPAAAPPPAPSATAPAPVETTRPAASSAISHPVHAPLDVRLQIKNEVMHTLQTCKDIPAFSATTQKLMDTISQRYVTFAELAEVVRLDPGLASKYLRLANSVAFGGQNITDISHALLRLGFDEIRRLAMGIEVIDRLAHLCEKIDWNQFWLHSLLTAQFTERLANAYQPMSGKEYVAGLLHDIGKLFLQKYFPQQFNSVVLHTAETGCSSFEAEMILLDVTHPEIGAGLCEKWRLNEEITRSIRFHHEPSKAVENSESEPGNAQLLAACICVGDSLAKLCSQKMVDGKLPPEVTVESVAEWNFLNSFTPRSRLELNMNAELQKAKDTIAAVALPVRATRRS
ncbi:MAG: HDOD domain-containing protein [Verrucomicrobia bacterium]|nr:HDOD domain-containing protein [Verrucomicrobiota bacterium]